jgi:adenine-specific DNA-methyltransferase
MNRLKMISKASVFGNVERIAALFPNCVTERLNKDGKPEAVIDFDKLRDELSTELVEGSDERYQFTWPDKRIANHLANTPTTMTLRPCREESVDFDNTENLYIEGDNLDVLKVLRETYLGKVKMIYIDPPYNTGNDFVYNDDFTSSYEEFAESCKVYDEDGNLTFNPKANGEGNGRFHTDWLNMIYPRMKVARDLLSDDGVIVISIDDNEKENLSKVCDEVFGELNFVATFPWRKRTAKSDVPFGVSQDFEWLIVYAKSSNFVASLDGKERKYYETQDFPDRPWRVHDMTTQRTALERPNSNFTIVNPKTGDEFPVNPQAVWRITKDGFPSYLKENRIIFPGDYEFLRISKPVLRYWKEDDIKKDGESFGRVAVSTKLEESVGMSQDGTKEIMALFDGKVFSFPKPSSLIKSFIKIINDKSSIILDFFSGSATTAHAVMKLNAEDGGNRKFIMVQLPEVTDEKSEARKAGYNTICEIGKERIRRAGKQILDSLKKPAEDLFSAAEETPKIDVGFRVLKLDSSNMEDVYYTPEELDPTQIVGLIDNVKADRTPMDLLFQVMPQCGCLFSDKIVATKIEGKEVFNVDDGYLIACFDQNVSETTIIEIAKQHPVYFVMRDASAQNDNVMDNFEQLFRHYSPETNCRII